MAIENLKTPEQPTDVGRVFQDPLGLTAVEDPASIRGEWLVPPVSLAQLAAQPTLHAAVQILEEQRVRVWEATEPQLHGPDVAGLEVPRTLREVLWSAAVMQQIVGLEFPIGFYDKQKGERRAIKVYMDGTKLHIRLYDAVDLNHPNPLRTRALPALIKENPEPVFSEIIYDLTQLSKVRYPRPAVVQGKMPIVEQLWGSSRIATQMQQHSLGLDAVYTRTDILKLDNGVFLDVLRAMEMAYKQFHEYQRLVDEIYNLLESLCGGCGRFEDLNLSTTLRGIDKTVKLTLERAEWDKNNQSVRFWIVMGKTRMDHVLSLHPSKGLQLTYIDTDFSGPHSVTTYWQKIDLSKLTKTGEVEGGRLRDLKRWLGLIQTDTVQAG